MEISLLAFASSSDAFGFTSRQVSCDPDDTPLTIVRRIAPQVDIGSLRVALDCEFTTWDTPVRDARELAFIPPVSGG
ncbi:MoaD/ThiS family protein [Luteolibacter yonseiensis]|uniref:MoaD/ThiS family protein n=1 Tax=Luteolibacter yonseiensis TaxID=1144680 RepID=A0A934R0R0_9BACT|nr:MoaD/ThiS family protein [Luteolibacter yonseiensis]MBK1814766.1 MoaD/ThiS family protein [Luteolibacter yonseiensis]